MRTHLYSACALTCERMKGRYFSIAPTASEPRACDAAALVSSDTDAKDDMTTVSKENPERSVGTYYWLKHFERNSQYFPTSLTS